MGVSKWAYSPEKCDGEYCAGDCDHCYKARLTDEIFDTQEDVPAVQAGTGVSTEHIG